ncbi:MAG TPA: CPBP family intramembrane glutamic endopeptidase [Rhizomicrobium sp.]|nr:CPBP family intramembrane glutamic endopeptidase [Rhizomicrobium sp.]
MKPPRLGGLRGWGPLGILGFLAVAAGTLVFVPLAALLVLLWAWLSKTPWREIGLARPKSWTLGLVFGIALGIGLKFAMKAAVMPLLGADPVNHTYQYLTGDGPAALKFAIYAVFGAGVAEEVVFRGYLYERLGALYGCSLPANLLTLALGTAIFGAAHWEAGVYAMINAGIVGLVIGALYLANGRKLWTLMVAHASFDLTAAAMIYLNLETRVAHLVFS